ncbi:MAG: FTR1 family protein [Gammaproteobacteria bacterium]
MRIVLISLCLAALVSGTVSAQESPAWRQSAQSAVSALDYVAIDYPVAVSDGQVVNEAEYAEQREFAATVLELLGSLPDEPGREGLLSDAGKLVAAVESLAPADEIAQICRALAADVVRTYDIAVAPAGVPDPEAAAPLFAAQCAMCHGVEGRGDGPAATALEPPPTDFHDDARARQRSLYGLYSTITLGVEGTGMAAFAALDEASRWNLAFYVAGLGDDAAAIERGRELWNGEDFSAALPSLASLTSQTPAEVADAAGPDAEAAMTYLRHHPEALGSAQPSPLARAREGIEGAVAAYAGEQPEMATRLALTAYLEGYELVEAPLRTLDADMALDLERDMQAFRNLIREAAPVDSVRAAGDDLVQRLDAAGWRLDDEGLSPVTVFFSALLILLREGLEAILILAALAMYLRRTEHHRGLAYMHFGWAGALAAGVVTWIAAQTLIEVSGAQRETVEGIAALLASGVLLYVGIWLHRHSLAARWQAFLRERMGRSLSAGALWGIAGLAFIAVYREILETLLFYQALWLQSARPAPLMGGAAVAAIALVVLAWLVFRVGARLPLRQFFRANGILMFALAVVFAGKGVAALQEAGVLPAALVTFPRIDLLGVYPTVQSLGAQLGCLLIGAAWLIYSRREKVRAAV